MFKNKGIKMRLWEKPLTQDEINVLIKSNEKNGPIEFMDGPIGPMVRLVCSYLPSSNLSYNKIFYCGGDLYSWMEQEEFFDKYPEYDKKPKMIVEMELEEIHQAQELMEGLCRDH